MTTPFHRLFLAGLVCAALGLSACGTSQEKSSSVSTSNGAGGNRPDAGGTGGAQNVDECALGTSNCPGNSACVDTADFYRCECNPGFKQDGQNCIDIDECAALLSDCAPSASCTNTVGGFTCACPAGFSGDGKSCTPIYTKVSAGSAHACAIRSDQTLWCWGLNQSGQLGVGTSDVGSTRPVSASDAKDWLDVALGQSFSCALEAPGSIACWGSNSYGQIGDGTAKSRPVPTPVQGGLTDFVSFDAGSSHVCAIRSDGSLYCWGHNKDGQLGVGSNADASSPTLVSAGPWTSVSAGADFSCAVRSDHSLWCWGLGSSRQLGNGQKVSSNVPIQEGTNGLDWSTVAAGNGFTCALKMNGARWCWGTNYAGQAGNGAFADVTTPTQVDMDATWSAIATADAAGCGLRAGALSCWGDGSVGQTAQPGAETISNVVTPAGAESDWKVVAGGSRFFCGLRQGGRLSCWGSATRGATGLGYSSDRASPSPVGSDLDWSAVQVQTDDGCGIHATGKLSCWGRNIAGEIGDGTTTTRPTPVDVGAGKTWKRVGVGRTHSCGIANDGGADAMYCWGSDNYGEAGNGAGSTPSLTPAPIAASPGNSSPYADLAVGSSHTCAIRADKSLWCWGRNNYGQLGDGTTSNQSAPTQVGAATDWASITTAGETTCGLRSGGILWCWGRNDNGQLGLGLPDAQLSAPAQLSGSWSFASMGSTHGCAVSTTGSLWCWGRNTSGELGFGNTMSPVSIPAQVGMSATWLSVATGISATTCALDASGDVYCFGSGSYGQLGSGAYASATSPQKIASGGGFSAIAVGSDHGCAIRQSGELTCWGASYAAQLGATAPFVSTPTLLASP